MKKRYIWGIIAAIAIVLAFVLGLQSYGTKAGPKTPASVQSSTATVKIKNGASEPILTMR